MRPLNWIALEVYYSHNLLTVCGFCVPVFLATLGKKTVIMDYLEVSCKGKGYSIGFLDQLGMNIHANNLKIHSQHDWHEVKAGLCFGQIKIHWDANFLKGFLRAFLTNNWHPSGNALYVTIGILQANRHHTKMNFSQTIGILQAMHCT